MQLKSWRTWRVSFVRLALVTSILFFSGCQTVTPTKAEISHSGTTEHSQVPNSEREKKEIPRSSEIPQAPIPRQEPEPIPEQKVEPTPSVPVDESDKEPAPTPSPDLPQTPIHPYYDLGGAPPSAPGLAMRVRVFDVEPQKIAYLTFDDGPHPKTTPSILKILQDEDVKATFFVVGRQVEMYPDLLKAEYKQGEGIGNHSYSHDYHLLYRSPEAFLAEIKQTDELIFNTIGARPRIVRAPGGTQGHFHINYYNTVDAADYLIYDWNVSIGDADAPLVPADQLILNLEAQVPGKSRIIILMHDAGAKLTTVDALPKIIQYLKDQGYSFGVITPKVAPILFPGGFHS
ncbi:MAG TPA: polysaccharide deacetylase family protein [Desulfosporosinus sp.]|nr:polysaccharide deacetylase family protein [Desulfosporosinus sp.]